jgi:energy-coupling factor transport system permease protein
MQSVYLDADSPLHRLHPLTKLAATVLVVLSAYLLPGVLTPLALFVVVLLAAAVGRSAGWVGRTIGLALLPIVVSIVLIQGVFFPPLNSTPLRLGPITLTVEGLQLAFVLSTRLLTFSAAVLTLLRTTHPADLVTALTERGLPRSVGYILLVSLQIAPDMIARAGAIQDAQRSRGMETRGVLNRLRALPPLVGPLIVGALSDTEERAMALESRAFTAPGPKTSWRVLHDSGAQRVARALMLLAIVALVVARVTVLRGLA